jgi:hypothetical protein
MGEGIMWVSGGPAAFIFTTGPNKKPRSKAGLEE